MNAFIAGYQQVFKKSFKFDVSSVIATESSLVSTRSMAQIVFAFHSRIIHATDGKAISITRILHNRFSILVILKEHAILALTRRSKKLMAAALNNQIKARKVLFYKGSLRMRGESP